MITIRKDQSPTVGLEMRCPPPFLLLLLPLLPCVLGGPGDTVDQLRVGFSIVPLADQVPVLVKLLCILSEGSPTSGVY